MFTLPKRKGPKKKRIGIYTLKQRKKRLKKWYRKRARIIKNQLEGKLHQYTGRTKFAHHRPRVKGRFAKTKFMEKLGIKFDSTRPGWVCETLGGVVFATADEAVTAVEAKGGVSEVNPNHEDLRNGISSDDSNDVSTGSESEGNQILQSCVL